ncbi:formimidoyltransferase-cyclodeaminase-like [Benincasa hispida]|uniref:formimidoyltransferase-cyclodeaminase-like n=1 Tax=Benincasa hispida TaxID=102211 RepID=UPI001900A79A|nr:formimidoyltransferase-cyclodeaminase-like [Benincasa hispida]
MDDIFDSSLNLEETHLKEGFAEGYKDGLVAGKEEAEQVGLKVGFEVGEELGFYRGCVDVWNSVIRIEPERFSIRVRKSVKQMEELVEKYPLQDPENEQVQELMEGLRLKFRAISATLGVKLEYTGYPKSTSDGKDIEFPAVKRKKMSKLVLACCKVYISESRNKAGLESIEQAAKLFPDAPIINKFTDEVYNRVGYTLVSKLPSQPSGKSCSLRSAVLNMVKAAFSAIDLNLHCGSHPRLGVVDHICFHPLASASLDDAAVIAKSLAADIGCGLQVPTFLYGAAHEEGRKLAMIRRELGYFKPNSDGLLWAGGLKSDSLPLRPDEGPAEASKAKGVVVIGATKWVDNYNVPIFSTNIGAIRKIAKQVSERGGGLSSVQAMALAHDEGVIEVACNLLESNKVGGKMVQQEVERLAENEGLGVGKGYFTDLSQESIIERYLKLLSL